MQVTGLGYTNPRARNIGFLKRYTDSSYKVVHMRSVRLPGFEERNPQKQKRKSGHSAAKLKNSLSRSRSTVWELALCNPWDWFVTLTLDKEKCDRYDLNATYKQLGKFINNYNSRTDAAIKYLLIPEPHKDGAWHFHGLVSGLPPPHLKLFTLQDNIPLRLKDMLREGRQVYTWPAYVKAFGFVTLERILDPERCASYMTKYITKELEQSSIELNYHLYYCSKGLRRAELLYRGDITRPLSDPDFENDYVRIKRFSDVSEALSYFCDLEV